LLFLHLAPLPAVTELLRERLGKTQSAMAKVSAIKKRVSAGLGTGNGYLMDHLIAVRQLDRRWLRRLVSKVQTGKVRAPQFAAIQQLESFSRARDLGDDS
jgi:hypothetical protein